MFTQSPDCGSCSSIGISFAWQGEGGGQPCPCGCGAWQQRILMWEKGLQPREVGHSLPSPAYHLRGRQGIGGGESSKPFLEPLQHRVLVFGTRQRHSVLTSTQLGMQGALLALTSHTAACKRHSPFLCPAWSGPLHPHSGQSPGTPMPSSRVSMLPPLLVSSCQLPDR